MDGFRPQVLRLYWSLRIRPKFQLTTKQNSYCTDVADLSTSGSNYRAIRTCTGDYIRGFRGRAPDETKKCGLIEIMLRIRPDKTESFRFAVSVLTIPRGTGITTCSYT